MKKFSIANLAGIVKAHLEASEYAIRDFTGVSTDSRKVAASKPSLATAWPSPRRAALRLLPNRGKTTYRFKLDKILCGNFQVG
jgi:hypothetical protein